MTEAGGFRLEIRPVYRVGERWERDLLDANSARFERGGLGGVVGHQSHPFQSQLGQDRGGGTVLASVDGQTERGVRGDGVEPAILQRVGPQLVRQPDPPALLPEIEEYAGAIGDDGGQRTAELLAAVASKRSQHVAGPALGVEPDERCVAPGDVAVNEGDRFGAAVRIRERDRIKRANARRKTRAAESADATICGRLGLGGHAGRRPELGCQLALTSRA